MKKLAIIVASVASLAIATPVLACPHSDKADTATAQKDKKDAPKADATKATAKAKDTEKKDAAKPADDKAAAKPAEKVSTK